MRAPAHKPSPLSDDDYARQEEERYALGEPPETIIEAPEFLPIGSVEVERVETDWDYMLAHENPRLFDEWGIAR
jgi:hypothetical protein